MTKETTQKQLRVLEGIKTHLQETGYLPTYWELGEKIKYIFSLYNSPIHVMLKKTMDT